MLAEHVKVTQTNPTTPRHLDGDALARPCQHDDPGANPGAGPTSRDLYLYRSEVYYGSPIDGTHWLPNKEMTKLWEVSDETSTDRFPHSFSV